MRREFWLVFFVGMVLAGALPSEIRAEEPAPPPSGWTFDGGFYAWALWVQGDTTARGETFNVYADPVDLIDALDGPIIMANLEARRGRFAFYADVVYAEFGLDSDFVGEAQPIPAVTLTRDARVGADYTFGVYEAGAFYQVANFAGAKGDTTVELGAGARYIEQEFNIKAAIDRNVRLQLGRVLGRIENRIKRIENQEDRLETLAQFNALRADILKKEIVRAEDRGLDRRVARLENRLNRVDERGKAIAALEALDRLRLQLLKVALNLDNADFNDDLAFFDSGNMNWVDPVIALRVTHELGNGQSVTAMGDFGGFNIDDGLSWQAVLTYDREGTLFGFDTTTSIGYKALWLRFEEQTNKGAGGVDVVLHGPTGEVSFRW